MPFNIERITLINIVVVYQTLDLRSISRDSARSLITDAEPQLIDIPDTFVVVYPSQGIQCIFADRRIRINEGTGITPSKSLVPQLAKRAHNLIKGGKVVAYGFNFHFLLVAPNQKQPGAFLRDRFLANAQRLEKELGESITEIGLTLKFTEGGVSYSLKLDPAEAQAPQTPAKHKILPGIAVECNTHFDADELPSEPKLKAQFATQFDHLLQLLTKVFLD